LESGSLVFPDLPPVNITGADTPAFALGYQGHCLWLLGFPDKAMEVCRRALERADSLNHPFTAANVRLGLLSTLLSMSPRWGQQEAESMVAISAEHGFFLQEILGKLFRNSALIDYGGDPKILTELDDLIHAHKKSGAKLSLPCFLAPLAKGYGETSDPEQGLRIIDETLSDIERTSEYLMKAELHRLKGELLLMQAGANAAEAERQFRNAIDIARHQQAKSWELRATTSLARLLAKQNRRGEARTMLAEIYGWFTEGFDTPDLIEAKSLLDELSG
ncbi:MAG: hypothetical protein JOZ29_12075, partial [Deltaproteobacteria bacterium]|nr:hypothetical protein [Deltaproteobacteria bacterium]